MLVYECAHILLFFYLLVWYQSFPELFVNSWGPQAQNVILWSLGVRRPLFTVYCQQLLQKKSPPKLLPEFWPNLAVQLLFKWFQSMTLSISLAFKMKTLKSLLLWKHSEYRLDIWYVVIIDFSLTVKVVTLIFISGRGSAISSAKQGQSGSIYYLVKN